MLTPVTTPLDKIFSTLYLKGAIYLESIRLNDKQGDDGYRPLRHQLTPARLTDAERQRFCRTVTPCARRCCGPRYA